MSQGSLRRSSSAAPRRRSAEGFALFDVVRVCQAVQEHQLAGGEEGTIVEILDRPVPAYLVDLSGGSADPADPDLPVVALTADQLTLVWPSPALLRDAKPMDLPRKLGVPNHDFILVFGGTKIDYDRDKEETNRRQHGYSLESAVSLLERIIAPWGASSPHIVSDAFNEKGEVRHIHMSVDDCGDVVLMVTTMRPDETVRIISFRCASEQERECFREITGYAKTTKPSR